MAERIVSVHEKASGTLELALSGGLSFCIDATDARLCGLSLEAASTANTADIADTADRPGTVHRILVLPDQSGALLAQGQLLDDHVAALLSQMDQVHRAKASALSIAARSEQGTRQLHEKLIQRGFEPHTARLVTAWMYEKRYIDDRRYANLMIRAHMVRKGQGLARIKALLWPRIGLFETPRQILDDVLKALEPETFMTAIRRSADRFLKKAGSDAVHLESRLRAWLKKEGFPSSAIEQFMSEWEAHGD